MLELILFGNPQILLHGRPVSTLLAKSQGLIFFLALTKRPRARLSLATLFWPEKGEVEALTNLRQVIYDVRRKVPGLLEATHQSVQIGAAMPYHIDVERFVQGCDEHNPLAVREAAITLYHNEFLSGFHLTESAPFEEWVLLTRERLHILAVQTLTKLMLHYSARRHSAGLSYANRLLELEPWNEMAHRQKMMFLAWSGNKQAALAHYELCRNVLKMELNATPEIETATLYTQIRSGEFVPVGQDIGVQDADYLQDRLQNHCNLAADEHDSVGGTRLPSANEMDNLPLQTTRFVGRSAEVAGVVQHLLDPDCRLITLIGLGGTGKTRLAVEVARRTAASFRHGVCFVDLSGVESVTQTPAAIAAALKLTANNQADPLTLVTDHLAPQSRLLVLDNLEHLSGMDVLIMTLLQHAPGLKILGTSRFRLNLQAEWVFDVHGLAIPRVTVDATDVLLAEEVVAMLQNDAVQFFIQSARRVSASFSLDEHNAAAVAVVCQMTDGTPLAIELAAGWVRVLSCQAIAEEISQNLDALTTAVPGFPTRQRSMHSVFISAWQHLHEHEQQALMVLSVMHGDFDRRAALSIAGVDLVMLATFIDHSFVLRAPPMRYKLHELMRQFLYQKLSAQPELLYAASSAHAHHYATFVQGYHDLEVGAVTPKVKAIEAELENIRAAWRWLLKHLTAPDAVAHLDGMVEALHCFFDLRSQYREGVVWFADALAQLEPVLSHHCEATTILCGRVMSRLARFHYYLGNFAQTKQLAQRSLIIARRCTQSAEIAFCSMRFGYLAKTAGNHGDAITHFSHALEIYAQLGDHTGVVWALNGLGLANLQSGHLSVSRSNFLEARQLAKSLDNLMLDTVILNNLGAIYVKLGDYTLALSTLQECLRLNEYLDDLEGIGYANWSLAGTLSALGEVEAAHEHSVTSLRNFQTVGYQRGIVYALLRTGEILLMKNHVDAAADSLLKAQEVVERFDMSDIVPASLLALARLELARQQLTTAHAYGAQALNESQRLAIDADVACAQLTLGEIALARQQFADAYAHFHAAILLAQGLELIPLLLEASAGLAHIFQHQGKDELAITLLTFVLNHKGVTATVRQRAQRSLQELAPNLIGKKEQEAQRIVAVMRPDAILEIMTGQANCAFSVD